MKSVIEAKNIGKKYNITHQQGGYIALRDVLTGILKNPFAFLKTKTKQLIGFDTKEEFWALKDINFTIHKGEVVGIIGSNGAGKSTLLKILSQITPPTTGEIQIDGRVGSLLEVGTGFHPELTGRENIFLNGAILGMHRSEIAEKFDAIVSFAEIEKFLDTPVKYYSSGMYVRLAFSVAAHMEPDILIVDEVLAVGDIEFQKKCLGKMDEITKTQKRTILFVSHNMGAIQKLCKECILLERGEIKKMGPTAEVIAYYSASAKENKHANMLLLRDERPNAFFQDVAVTTTMDSEIIKSSDKLRIRLAYNTPYTEPLSDGRFVITITSTATGQTVLMLDSYVTAKTWKGTLKPSGSVLCETAVTDLAEGLYTVTLDFIINGISMDYVKDATTFTVVTDIEEYGYKNNPDSTTCQRMIAHNFKQL